MSETRNIDDAYRDARIAEYKDMVRSGNKDGAERLATILKDRHGYDVTAEKKTADEPAAPEKTGDAPERKDQKAPEKAVDPKPQQPSKPAAKKTAQPAAKNEPAKNGDVDF